MTQTASNVRRDNGGSFFCTFKFFCIFLFSFVGGFWLVILRAGGFVLVVLFAGFGPVVLSNIFLSPYPKKQIGGFDH